MAPHLTTRANTSPPLMASNSLKPHHPPPQTFKPPPPFSAHHQRRLTLSPSNALQKSKFPTLSLSASASPPSSKEEAIRQAKTCLSSSLEKPLNNPKLAGKLKKLKQPRFQVEIPIVDDSPSSLSVLALQIFRDIPIKRKGSSTSIKFVLLWPDAPMKQAALRVFDDMSESSNVEVEQIDLSESTYDNNRSDSRGIASADVAVFLAPEASNLDVVGRICDSLYPKPVVILNPRWDFDDDRGFGEMKGFVDSFDVIYSLVGLEVQGLLSKRKGLVFKCVSDGVVSGEKWEVLVEEDGQMRVVTRFKARPSIEEVENVLYNLMAVNSPITKSAKFLRDLVSNVTGKKYFPFRKPVELMQCLDLNYGW